MPPGTLSISSHNVVCDSGLPDAVEPDAGQIAVEDLPDEALEFLLGSRYCETDRLSDTAWSLFGRLPPGWARVQAICDYVHDRITFSYPDARSTRTAWDGHQERIDVCRDFAHLAIALCRCMNIPARYCTIAPVISVTSVCRRFPTRWISAPGSRSFSRVVGIALTPGTIG